VQNETQSTTTKSGVETKTREHDTRKENEKDNDQTPEKHATREKKVAYENKGIRNTGDDELERKRNFRPSQERKEQGGNHLLVNLLPRLGTI